MEPCCLPHQVALQVISCQPLLDLLEHRGALDFLAVGKPDTEFSLQGWVITELRDIQGLLIRRAVQAPRRFDSLGALRVPEIELKLLSTRLHIPLSEELLVVEPHEERQVGL